MQYELRGIGKTLPDEVHIHPLDLVLDPSSFNVLLGPIRSGKTTLLRLLAGLDRPSQGQLLADDGDITNQRLGSRRVAMVYQEFINYPNLSVHGNIASPLRRRLSKGEACARAAEFAALVHIEHLLDRRPHELSGGQQQRLAIARALACDADLLLLDEPLVNLDLKLREELREELTEILGGSRATVVYATSEPQEALILGGRVALLHEGRLIQQDQTLQAYHRPASALAGQLFSDPPMNQWPVHLNGDRADLAGNFTCFLQAVPVDSNGSYLVGLRANHVHLRQRREDWIPLPIVVDMAEINGSETFIHGRHEGLRIIVQEDGAHHHAVGSRITCYLDPTRLLWFDEQGERLLRAYREAA